MQPKLIPTCIFPDSVEEEMTWFSPHQEPILCVNNSLKCQVTYQDSSKQ